MNKHGEEIHRVTVPVRPDCFARTRPVLGSRPALVIEYEGVELEFVMEDPEEGHEFGVALAHAALNFGSRCRSMGGGRHV